jgi:hypothetical protein
MGKILVKNTKDFMAKYLPNLAALLHGDWIVIDENTKVKVDDQIVLDADTVNGEVNVTFENPLPIEVTRGWGPFQAAFSGTITGVLKINRTEAQLALQGMPPGQNSQVLEWAE